MRQTRRFRPAPFVSSLVQFIALLAVLIALPAGAAEADDETTVGVVVAASHQGVRAGDAIVWKSRFVLDGPRVGPVELSFAAPLPPGQQLESEEGVVPIMSDGQITGVWVAPGPFGRADVHLSFVQPGVPASTRFQLGAPIAAGRAPQVVDVRGDGETLLEPDQALAVERFLGFKATPSAGADGRQECLRRLSLDPDPSRSPLFLRGEDVRVTAGLYGKLTTAKERSLWGAVGAGIAFVTAIGGLFWGWRRLDRTASVERADALLAAKIDRLGD